MSTGNFEVLNFMTYAATDGPEAVARTIGKVVVVQGGVYVPERAAQAVKIAASFPDASSVSAYGKVVFIDPETKELCVYQTVDSEAGMATCVNGTAAGLKLLGLPDVVVHLHHSRTVVISGFVTASGAVAQRWTDVPFESRETEVNGRTAVVCKGGLNDYAIVPINEDPRGYREADGFLRDLNFTSPAQSRLMIVNESMNLVAIYTCGGKRNHPTAAPSGLANLGAAAQLMPSLSHWRNRDRINTPGGEVTMPIVHITSGTTISVEFNPIRVHLERLWQGEDL